MIDKTKKVSVTNRDNGSVTYIIPDLNNLRRTFQSGETKEVEYGELSALRSVPGGENILNKYLVIHDEEVVAELLGEVEPEYNYTKEDIIELLNNGTLEQLEDCLNFAPAGVINLVKKYAVDNELNDVRKRKLIQEKTQFNVDKAIEINHETEDEGADDANVKVRQAAPITSSNTAPTRKVITIKK